MSTLELARSRKPKSTDRLFASSVPFRQRFGDSALWTSAAPAKVVRAFLSGDTCKGWTAWKRHLLRRTSPIAGSPFEEFGAVEVVHWGLESRIETDLVSAIGPVGDENRAFERILANGRTPLDESTALAHLACAYALPALSATLADELWWDLLAQLHRVAVDAAALDVTTSALLHQWLAGELPLALGCLFPEIAPCVELLPHAQCGLLTGFETLLDGHGLPHRRFLTIQQPLAACWTRVQLIGASLGKEFWKDNAFGQFQHMVRQMLRLACEDGTPLFAGTSIEKQASSSIALFFSTAVDISDNERTRAALQRLRWRGFGDDNAELKRPCSPAMHSESAQVAVLRPHWKRSSPGLGVSYGDRTFRGEFVRGRDRIFTGDWRFTCTVDHKETKPTGDWEELCWVSDEDIDYLELEIRLTEGIRIQRQFCLGRKDRFLFLADAVLTSEPRLLHYKVRIPFGPEITAAAATETREVTVHGRKPRALIFPLALPEWRIDRRGGELTADTAGIELQQTMSGKGLYAPLWIDLDPRRREKPFTWRHLTVTEERKNQPRDVAAGFRVQVGKRQWLIYRSLGRVANRTVLGHNLATDFLIARFGRDGGVTTLVEVE